MATTTNYGWTTPDDTALVKDGASAIRTLGSSIDTTTKNLNPSTTLGDLEYRSSTSNTNTRIPIGTSGQGLQVVAGVPAWAASSTSTLTTTGDLLYASAANTLARRAIGTTGQVLTVSGGLPTWATPGASVPANGNGKVASNESTTSTSFTNLTTSGPSATVTTGTKALVLINSEIYNSSTNAKTYVSFDVSGATTSSATDARGILFNLATANQESKWGVATVITGLTAGSNTFTCRYRVATGTGYFANREITVIDLGS